MLPVSLVDSVTAKVDDEKKDLAYSIYMWYTSCYILFKRTFYILFIWFLIWFLNAFYIHPIHIEGQDEGQKVATRKIEDGQKTLFPRNVCGPLGCQLLSSLVPKSRFRGSGKVIFFKKNIELEKDVELPPEHFPCGGSA